MRKVMVSRRTHIVRTNTWVTAEVGEAVFHCWGSEAIEFSDGFAVQTVAIVEFPDGRIDTPIPNMIRFIEPQKQEQKQ